MEDISVGEESRGADPPSFRRLGYEHLLWFISRSMFLVPVVVVTFFLKFPLDEWTQRRLAADIERDRLRKDIELVEYMDKTLSAAKTAQNRLKDAVHAAVRLDSKKRGLATDRIDESETAMRRFSEIFEQRDLSFPPDIEELFYDLDRSFFSGGQNLDHFVHSQNPTAEELSFEADFESIDNIILRLNTKITEARSSIGQIANR